MKKTFTINISGTIFHIEDDAYEELQSYLISLKNHFGPSEEGNEIIADIEARIAELFNDKIKSDKEIVTIEWVNQVIRTMGSPEDFAAAEETPGEPVRRQKRLYRNPEKKVIGGVCGGLGAYFNMDPLILRIIMIVLALFNGVGVLAYLILWIAVPRASTTSQRLEMRGQEATVSNIEKSVRDDEKTGKEAEPGVKEKKAPVASDDRSADFFKDVLKIFVIVIGVFLIITGFFGLLGIISGLVLGQSIASGWPVIWSPEMPFTGFLSHFVSPGALSAGIISMGILAGIPLLALLFLGTKMVFRYKSNNTAIIFSMVGLWLAALVMIMIVGVGQFKNFRSASSSLETVPVNCSGCQTLYLDLGTDKYKDSQDLKWDLDNFRAVIADDKEIILGEPRVDVEKSSTDDFVMVIKKTARGKNRFSAKELTDNIIYYFSVKDSSLLFDPYFSLGEKSTWRNQKVEITLKVPEGKSIYLGERMAEIIFDIENVSNTWDGDMIGKYWEMKPEGLTLKEK